MLFIYGFFVALARSEAIRTERHGPRQAGATTPGRDNLLHMDRMGLRPCFGRMSDRP
jgi:hypothetical protein